MLVEEISAYDSVKREFWREFHKQQLSSTKISPIHVEFF